MSKLNTILIYSLLFIFTSSAIYASIEKKEEKTFNVEAGGKLWVDTDKGSISIKTHPASTIEVVAHLKAKTNDEELAEKLFTAFKIDYDQSGADLKIEAKYKGNSNWLSKLFGGSKWNKLNIKFLITVPENYNVELYTSGGGISVDDLTGYILAKTSGGGLTFGNIMGDIKGKTSGGGITVGSCSGDIDISTSGGGIKIDKCEGEVDAHTSGGGVTVNEVYGPINASTSGGSVYASIREQPKEKCSLKTSGGGITVKLVSTINANLDAKTSGGSVQSDIPVKFKGKVKRSQLSGELNGGGPLLYLRTSGGSIHIEEI